MRWVRWTKDFGLTFYEGYEVTNYRYYPRGRVSFIKEYEYMGTIHKNAFELVMDKCLIANDRIINSLLTGCNLSWDKDKIFVVNETEVNDEHYICHNAWCGNQKRKEAM
jgi:hypothetical protein